MSTHVEEDETKDGKNPSQDDNALLLQTDGLGPFLTSNKKDVKHMKDMAKRIADLAASSEWDLVSDEEMMQEEQPLQRPVPDISPPASMFASSGITRVLPSCMVSPTRNGVHHPALAGPEWLPLSSMLTCALSRNEEFGFFEEYEIQTQPNSPENFSFSAFEEALKNYSAVEDGNHAAVEEGLTKHAAFEEALKNYSAVEDGNHAAVEEGLTKHAAVE